MEVRLIALMAPEVARWFCTFCGTEVQLRDERSIADGLAGVPLRLPLAAHEEVGREVIGTVSCQKRECLAQLAARSPEGSGSMLPVRGRGIEPGVVRHVGLQAIPEGRCRVCRRKFNDKRRDRRPDREDKTRCRGCGDIARAMEKKR